MTDILIFDSRNVWHKAMTDAAHRRGWTARRITRPEQVRPARFGFIRPHPGFMAEHIALDESMRSACTTMVQDRQQVVLYEDKTSQHGAFGQFMPETVTTIKPVIVAPWIPVVSKANEGASSVNVRVITTQEDFAAHVEQVFSPSGIPVNRCADQMMTTQHGYLFLQRFIPHDRTYRVNIIGNRAAIFERYNYADKPVAQTGNTRGIYEHTELHESLLKYAFEVAQAIGSKWVALDILRDHEREQWYLLETSLAWPWNTTEYGDVPFTGGGTWGELWGVLYDQLEDGVFGSTSP